jgi:hypothetical protein
MWDPTFPELVDALPGRRNLNYSALWLVTNSKVSLMSPTDALLQTLTSIDEISRSQYWG